MASTNITDYIDQVDTPRDVEFSKEVSVYRYGTATSFSPRDLDARIEENLINSQDFGILSILPPNDRYIRTFWAKLSNKTLPIVNDSGELTYWRARRVIASSSVVEFYSDDNDVGLILFGGAPGMQTDIIRVLENRFSLKNIGQQQMRFEQMRSLFARYGRQIKEINLDPSDDSDWGDVRDAKLVGFRGKYINPDAQILQRIRSNQDIRILGFRSELPDVRVDGMRESITVAFEVTTTHVKISARRFEVLENREDKAAEVFYDLAREVYFKVVGDEKWVSGILNDVGPQQLSYFGVDED
ncbi:MAG: hypothetical protein KF716_12400 [Anaerolineae bacterium]|nr:hypothetical protein [Anaerolineae bacterium]